MLTRPLPHYRPETWDERLSAWVLANEYRLPDAMADWGVVADVGAHIGSFAVACLRRGAPFVHCFEVDHENAVLCQRNLEDETFGRHRWAISRSAVWHEHGAWLRFSGYGAAGNTGSGGVVLTSQEGGPPTAQSTALDSILGTWGQVGLLKVDCEGAEWPILLTSQELRRVERICGEYHEVGGPYDQHTIPAHARVLDLERYTWPLLQARLERAGFTVYGHRHIDPEGRHGNNGAFWAWRGEVCPFLLDGHRRTDPT